MTNKSIRNMPWPPEAWELREGKTLQGAARWALRTGEATIRFFRLKADAEAFWDEMRTAHAAGKQVAC